MSRRSDRMVRARWHRTGWVAGGTGGLVSVLVDAWSPGEGGCPLPERG